MASPTGIDMNEASYFRNVNGGYVSIELEPYPENPRAFYDELGTFLTWGSRFSSPDENRFSSPEDFMVDAVGEKRAQACETMQDCLQALDEAGYAARGIYRFEHGQVRYALGEANPFSDRWDSGTVGFAYVSPEKLEKEGMTKENAITCMEAEMREYSAWANGDVFLAVEYDELGEAIDQHTLYGMEDFEEAFPSIEPIDMSGFADLREYAEHSSLTESLENDWTFHPATKEFPRDHYAKESMAIVANEGGDAWRIVDRRSGNISYAACDSPQEALKQLNQYQATPKETLRSFLPPDPARQHLSNAESRESAIERKPLYVLTETMEDSDAIREFRIVGISEDRELLQSRMQQLVEDDAYGFFQENGFEEQSESSASSVFECGGGFVSYDVSEVPFLVEQGLDRDRNGREMPLDDLMKEAREKAAEKNVGRSDAMKTKQPPEMGL